VSYGESAAFAQHDDNEAKSVGGVLMFNLPTRGLFDRAAIAVNGYADTPGEGERTRTWGLEAETHRGKFEMLLEFARRRAVEDRSGVYVQPSYRFTDRLTTFYRYDRLAVGLAGATEANTVGINVRPIPPVSLKFEYFRTRKAQSRTLFNGIASSLAVAF
jgi:hypothetical protein